MDIFRFIDSADIRRYLVEIQYRFSTEEKMFLIWYCKTATLNEKIAAWQEIVGYVQGCPWDYAQDAIQTYSDGEWLTAKGTTLGADDGIGCAMELAILDSE